MFLLPGKKKKKRSNDPIREKMASDEHHFSLSPLYPAGDSPFWLLLLSLVLGYEIWRKMKLRCHDVALIYVSRTPVFSGFPLTLRQGRGA